MYDILNHSFLSPSYEKEAPVVKAGASAFKMPDTGCRIPDDRYRMSDIGLVIVTGYKMQDTQCRMHHKKYPAKPGMFLLGYWLLGVGY